MPAGLSHMKKQRNAWIDILRFVFAVLILLFHMTDLKIGGKKTFQVCPDGYIGVEFFCLVSGFLMAATAARLGNTDNPDTGTLTLRFIRRKLSVFYPYYVIAFLFALVTWMIRYKDGSFGLRLTEALWELLLVKGIGLGDSTWLNGAAWYLSAMIFCMLIIFPCLIRKRKLYIYVIAPVASLLLLAHLYSEGGGFQKNTAYLGINYWGLFRAFAELNLGCICYEMSTALSRKNFRGPGKAVLTCAEVALYAVTVFSAFKTKGDYDYILLAALLAGVTLSFSGVTYTSRIPSGKASAFLGKFSLVLYLNHRYWEWLMNAIMPKTGVWPKYPLFLALCTASAFIGILIVDGGKALLACRKRKKQAASDPR